MYLLGQNEQSVHGLEMSPVCSTRVGQACFAWFRGHSNIVGLNITALVFHLGKTVKKKKKKREKKGKKSSGNTNSV